MNKKVINSIALQIIRLKREGKNSEYEEIKTILQIQGIYNLVEIEVFKLLAFKFKEYRNIFENLIKYLEGVYGKKNICIDNILNEVYLDDLDYIDNLSTLEKDEIKGKIKFIINNDNNYKFNQLMNK